MLENNLIPSNQSDALKFENKALKLISQGDKRKVSSLIEAYLLNGSILTSPEILKFILEPSGMTVAHKMAYLGYPFLDKAILKLKGEDRSKENSLYGHNGCSVAFIMARKGHTFDDPEILMLGKEENRSTVAHAMASKGFIFQDNSILILKDDKGTTVAHLMAANGFKFNDKKILALENNFGFTVSDFLKENSKDPTFNM